MSPSGDEGEIIEYTNNFRNRKTNAILTRNDFDFIQAYPYDKLCLFDWLMMFVFAESHLFKHPSSFLVLLRFAVESDYTYL